MGWKAQCERAFSRMVSALRDSGLRDARVRRAHFDPRFEAAI
jgi:hypothetical protein